MSGPGLALVLDGPRHVGRSTTLAALQHAWPRVRSGPLLEAGLDATLTALGPSRRRWSELVLPGAPPRDPAHPHLAWGPLGRELVRGMHRAAASWVRAGVDVGMDHTLFDQATLTDLTRCFADLTVLHVRFVCDAEVLDDREREAGGVFRGLAVAQLQAQREVGTPGLVVDTSEATTSELVEVILAAVATTLRG